MKISKSKKKVTIDVMMTSSVDDIGKIEKYKDPKIEVKPYSDADAEVTGIPSELYKFLKYELDMDDEDIEDEYDFLYEY